MPGRSTVATLCAALAAVTSAGCLTVAASPARAASTLPGTVLYDKGNNVFATDGVTTRQLTTDGSTPARDGTGTSGYLVPTQSDDGKVVVAVRNQRRTSSDQQTYYRGYLWVMDAYGHVQRKIDPPQFAYDGGTVCDLPANAPQGIVNAQVSPDGKHVAYTMRELAEVFGAFGCYVTASYRTTVVGIDGTSPVAIDDGSGQITATGDLEIGSWVSNSTLLLDRLDFGSVQTYAVTLPGPSARSWFGPSSDTDSAYAQPDLRNGVVVTEGFSDSAMAQVLRVWTTPSLTSNPTYRCQVTSPVGVDDDLSDPSLAPDGSRVAFQDTDSDGTAAAAGQGVYVMSTANGTCGTPQLLVPGANDAFWSPAGIDPPPSVVITNHPGNPTRSGTASFAFTVSHGATAPAVTCRLDGGVAAGCSSPVSYSHLADGVHTFTVTAGSASAVYAWRADSTRPTVTMTAPTSSGIAASSVTSAWSGRDNGSGIASYRTQFRTARYNGGFSAWAGFGPVDGPSVRHTVVSHFSAGYTYCLRVQATDRAGNVGYSAPRCFAVALDDRSLSAHPGWRRESGHAFYDRTATASSRQGATLTRTHAVFDRVGVVAQTRRGGGTVGIYVGHTLLGRISLAAHSTHYRAVLFLRAGRLRQGTVTVKVLTSGKPVVIDGLLIHRS